jgi:hypothetical protein
MYWLVSCDSTVDYVSIRLEAVLIGCFLSLWIPGSIYVVLTLVSLLKGWNIRTYQFIREGAPAIDCK